MEEKKKKKKSKTDWLGSIGLTLILTAVALLVWFFLKGETVVEGEFLGNDSQNSVTCTIMNRNYFNFKPVDSDGAETKVIMMFDNDKLKTISLLQKYFYNTNKLATSDSSRLSIAVGENLAKKELGYDALSRDVVVNGNTLQMSLYATGDEIDWRNKEFFIIDGSPEVSSEYIKNYTSKGFNCVEKIN